MSVLTLAISAFLSLMLIVAASVTIYMVEYALQENPDFLKKKTRPTRRDRRRRRETILPADADKTFEDDLKEGQDIDKVLDEINDKLEKHSMPELCLARLTRLKSKYPNNPKIAWMIGKAHERIVEKTLGSSEKMSHIQKGMEACQNSLDMDNNQAEAHKWMAILIGHNGQLQSAREKIQSGNLFKIHLDTALSLNPTDPMLQHMAGRFCYEISSLKWLERKIANAVFKEPLDCTFDTALDSFLQCEELSTFEWKENRLYIGKCYIAKEQYEKAGEWLKKAKNTQDESAGENVDKEINGLLEKYAVYF